MFYEVFSKISQYLKLNITGFPYGNPKSAGFPYGNPRTWKSRIPKNLAFGNAFPYGNAQKGMQPVFIFNML